MTSIGFWLYVINLSSVFIILFTLYFLFFIRSYKDWSQFLFGSFEITSIRLYTPLRNRSGLHGMYNLIEVISSWTEQKLRSILKYLRYFYFYYVSRDCPVLYCLFGILWRLFMHISRLVIGTSRTVGSAKKFVRITSGFGGGEFTKTLRKVCTCQKLKFSFLLIEYCKIRECYAVANAFTIRNMYSLFLYMKCNSRKINRPTKNMTKIVTLLHF